MARQKTIPGTTDEAPPEVMEAADKYLKHKRAVASGREKMNAALDELIRAMREADVVEFLIDDGEKKLILTAKDQIKIVARKTDKGQDEAEESA